MTDEKTFEELQRGLEEVVAKLERGEVPVDEAIALFERGQALYTACVELLRAAELRIEEISPAEPA